MPLVTTLQPRTGEVTADRFRGCAFLDVTDYDLEKILPIWNQVINFDPQELLKIFQRAFSEGFELKLGLDTETAGIKFELCSKNDPGNNFFFNIYDFKKSGKIDIPCSNFRLEPKARAENWGHKFDAYFAELNVALGVKEYSFDAMYENGAFIWPKKKYFMKLESEEDKSNRDALSRRVMARLSILEGIIPDDVYQEAIKLAQFKDKKDICRLANMDFDLSEYLEIGDFDSYYGHLYDALRSAFQSCNSPISWDIKLRNFASAKAAIKETMLFCRERRRVFTMGKFALVGEKIECVCNHDDDQQMKEIFGDGSVFQYTKFREIAPVQQCVLANPSEFRI